MMAKLNFQQLFLQSSVSHDPLVLKKTFPIIINVEKLCCLIFFMVADENSKEKHWFEINWICFFLL